MNSPSTPTRVRELPFSRPKPRVPRCRRNRSRSAAAHVCFAIAVLAATPALADSAPMPELMAVLDGREVALPTLKADFNARIQGDLASVRVTQLFENPYDMPLHARYVFPLPSDAAVYAMRLISGDQMIEAEIHEKQEARAVFENAKQRGNQAALLNQHRPNVFTQEVANLMPGQPIRVELEYAHVVEKSHETYRFHIPTVVGPRFVPKPVSDANAGAPTRQGDEPAPLQIGVWNLPASSPVAAPDEVDDQRVSIRVDLDGGMPIQWMKSPTHPLDVEEHGEARRSLRLASGRTLDNRDFELHYRLSGETVAAGLTTLADDQAPGQGFLSLLLEPPKTADDGQITAREMVFVLDCSGSMAGTPLAASKRFMRRTLRTMRAGDSFRIIRFSDSATQWSERPVPATPTNLREGERYVDSLFGSGGTHMASGIRAALAPPVEEGSLRIVVFLTDGYIGNDIEIVRLLAQKRGDARLFSFGIGNSVNRYLIHEMARVGRGAARIVKPNQDAQTAADDLAERLAAPVLTDIEVDWADSGAKDVFPREIPDLFLGQTVRVMARYETAGTHRVVIRGKVSGEPVALPLDVTLPALPGRNPQGDEALRGQALPILWARSHVEDRMIEFLKPGLGADGRDELQSEVTSLGLEYRLMTQWTSFVAVAKAVVNPGGFGSEADVAVAQVEGVPDTAYPSSALRKQRRAAGGANAPAPKPEFAPAPNAPPNAAKLVAAPQAPLLVAKAGGFQGHAAPEPSTWIAVLVLTLTAAVWMRRRPAAH